MRVLTELQLRYPIEEKYATRHPIRVENTSKGRALIRDIDYRVEQGLLIFSATGLSKGDLVSVWFD